MSIGHRQITTHARGIIFIVNLEPVIGSEQGGERRPCVTVGAEELTAGDTVLVVPFTKQGEKFHEDPAYIVRVPRRQSGLEYDSVLLANQVRVVSKQRLMGRVGFLAPEAMEELDAALRYVLGLE